MKNLHRRAVLIWFTLFGCWGCGASSSSVPDVLLITLDTTRQDRLGCYGRKEAHTPNIDRLASEGVRFANAYTCSPLTFPSHATMLTGVYPFVHQGHDNALFMLPPNIPTLATYLKQRGYKTGAFVSAVVLDGKFELDRDFDEYDDHFLASMNRLAGMVERPGNQTTDAAIAWLNKLAPGDRFFAWLHLFDPHRPWQAPSPFKDEVADPYDAEIAFADAQVGRVLEALAKAGRSDILIVVVADHGEGMGEHGETTHGMLIHDATMRVPLIVHHKGLKPGTVVPGFARTVDLAPTVLEGVGLPIPVSMQGVSLWPRMRGTFKDQEDPPAYLETYHPHYSMGWSYLEGLVRGRYKLVDAPELELYDLHEDPGEEANLADKQTAAVRAMGAELAALRNQATNLAPSSVTQLSPEDRAGMAALGYGTGKARPINREDRGLNPRKNLKVVDDREVGRELTYKGTVALRTGSVIAQQLQFNGAKMPSEQQQAMREQMTKQLNDALQSFTEAIDKYAQYEKFCRFKAQALEMLGGSYAQRAEANRALGNAEASTQDAERAVQLLEQALQDSPELLDGRINLATCYFFLGKKDKYEEQLCAAVKTYPKDPRAHIFLGGLYFQQAQVESDRDKRCALVRKSRSELESALSASQGVPEQVEQVRILIKNADDFLKAYCQ
jgi:arylsulfatase A-like enzyme